MTAETQPTADIEALSYEEAREQLVAIVSRLETGGASLEESLALWERGEALAKRCEQWLEGARKRLAAARDQTSQAGEPAQAGQERSTSSRSIATSSSGTGHCSFSPSIASSSSCWTAIRAYHFLLAGTTCHGAISVPVSSKAFWYASM